MRLLAVTSAVLAVALTGGAVAACPPAPEPVRDIVMERYYSDETGSQIDTKKKRAKDNAAAPLKAFREDVSKSADEAVSRRYVGEESMSFNGLEPACAVSWLASWARGGALLGRMSSKQAEAQRRFELAGLALAYIKLQPEASLDDRSAIEPWLVAVADKARAVFDDPGIKRNNHWYWMGLGLGAVGHATGSTRHLDAARSIMRDAARDIAPDGTLPLELKRGKRALHYHVFAAVPLLTLAEIGKARGKDWAAFEGGALARLEAVTLAGLDNTATFARLTGVDQERLKVSLPGDAVLAALSRSQRLLMGYRLPGADYLGGNAVSLFIGLGLVKRDRHGAAFRAPPWPPTPAFVEQGR